MRIIAALLHFLSALALLAAITAATFDAITSVAAGSAVYASLQSIWLDIDSEGPARMESLSQGFFRDGSWNELVVPLLALPAFPILLLIAFILWMAGYRRPPQRRRTAG